MRHTRAILLWCGVLIRLSCCADEEHNFSNHYEVNEQVNVETDSARGRRGVIEEEKYYNIQTHQQDSNINQPWMPEPLPADDNPISKISITNDVTPSYPTTERVTDKPTGRGARASNENWIKLPIPGRDDIPQNQLKRDQRQDDILTPPQPSGDLINSRMPRVNFVTQNKALETSESRNDKDAIQRATRTDDLRTEFVRPDEERPSYKPVFPRQAIYNPPFPDESRRYFYAQGYEPRYDPYRRDPYYDDRRRYYPVGPPIDRYDDPYESKYTRKPKRIIYYAHLPEVVRTPPNVDLRYRYSVDPYRHFDEDYGRTGRYYRFRNRYPYAPLMQDERNYRDLAGAGTVNKDKKVDEKVTPTPVLPQKEDKFKLHANKNLINSHQYHESADSYEPPSHKGFRDRKLLDHRADDPYYQGIIDEPYHRGY